MEDIHDYLLSKDHKPLRNRLLGDYKEVKAYSYFDSKWLKEVCFTYYTLNHYKLNYNRYRVINQEIDFFVFEKKEDKITRTYQFEIYEIVKHENSIFVKNIAAFLQSTVSL